LRRVFGRVWDSPLVAGLEEPCLRGTWDLKRHDLLSRPRKMRLGIKVDVREWMELLCRAIFGAAVVGLLRLHEGEPASWRCKPDYLYT
jgi:hypothetical protein